MITLTFESGEALILNPRTGFYHQETLGGLIIDEGVQGNATQYADTVSRKIRVRFQEGDSFKKIEETD